MTGYLGSKGGAGVYQAIVAQMPPHDTYIEAFLGSGDILRRKQPAARSIAIEIDPNAIALARAQGVPPGVEIFLGDACSSVAGFDYTGFGRTLIYADAPYVIGHGSARSGECRYRFEFTDDDHRRLANVLRDVPAAVMVSGYPSRLYDELYAGWRTLEFQAMTRGGVRTECLWMNFPAGAVHWATFAGHNRTRRQNIKRKAQSWAGKFRRMPFAERTAILAALLEVEATSTVAGYSYTAGAGDRSENRLRGIPQPDPAQPAQP